MKRAFSISLILICTAAVLGLAACSGKGSAGGDYTAPATPKAVAASHAEVIAYAAAPTVVEYESTKSATSPAAEQPTESISSGAETSGDADVLYVAARQQSADTWQFSVTIEHADLGWDDYADGWDVVFPDGTVAKPDDNSSFTRLLLHPHIDEQPFTRSQSGIKVPAGVNTIVVRAHDLVDGFGGREVQVNLTVAKGVDFEVNRLDS